MNEKIPVHIVTGQLGAGKTSMISKAIATSAISDALVLVNEFASLGIDQDIYELNGIRATALNGGCMCCEVRGEVRNTLQSLLFSRARGEMLPFSILVIETSGLASPLPIIADFASDMVLSKRFWIASVCVVIDSRTDRQAFLADRTSIQQVTAADLVYLSKTDLSMPRVQSTETINGFNPLAEITTDATRIWRFHSAAGHNRHLPWPETTEFHSDCVKDVPLAFVMKNDGVTPNQFERFIAELIRLCGDGVLRLKALVTLGDGDQSVALIQIAFGELSPSRVLPVPDRKRKYSDAVMIIRHRCCATFLELSAAHEIDWHAPSNQHPIEATHAS